MNTKKLKEEVDIDKIYRLLVDYDLAMETMIRLGKYDWVNGVFTEELYPTTHSGNIRKQLRILRTDRDCSTRDVLAQMRGRHTTPASIFELLAFAEMCPEVQREFPVVALGLPSRTKHPAVPYITGSESNRGLGCCSLAGNWAGRYHFLEVLGA
jgi:hypothetical protein